MVGVIRYWILSLVLVLVPSLSLYAQGVEVSTRVETMRLTANAPVEVTVNVSHPPDSKVDIRTFRYGDQPITVEFLGESTQTSISIINGKRTDNSRVITTYRFRLPAQTEGLHVLEVVSVEVDGVTYRSESRTFQVTSGQERGDFRLEATVEGPSPLFPGQRGQLVYRIYFKEHIELTVEELPLFSIEGLRHIGDKRFRGGVKDGFNVQEIAQDFEAERPGSYSVPESIIEGMAYRQDIFGRKIFIEPKLRATAPPFNIVVADFPPGAPDTFAGAVGQFSMRAERKGSGPVRVGDKVIVKVTITGMQPETVSLSPIGEQDAFRGRFRLSDLPPARKTIEDRAEFDVELRPLSTDIDAIPSIEWSVYNPLIKRYETLRTDEIPLSVVDAPVIEEPEIDEFLEETQNGITRDQVDGDRPVDRPLAIEIAGNYAITSDDLSRSWWETPHALWMWFLAGIGAISHRWRKRPKKRRKEGGSESEQLLLDAEECSDHPNRGLTLVAKALHLRLWEQGHISERVSNPDMLATTGIVGEVREFLMKMEEERFSGSTTKEALLEESCRSAKELFERL